MSKEIPKVHLDCGIYDKLPDITKVLNADQLEYFTWLHLPAPMARQFEIYQIDELIDGKYDIIDYEGFISRDRWHPWVRVITKLLNREVGQHIYRVSLVDTANNDTCALYFSYIIIDNTTDKPYKYIKDGGI